MVLRVRAEKHPPKGGAGVEILAARPPRTPQSDCHEVRSIKARRMVEAATTPLPSRIDCCATLCAHSPYISSKRPEIRQPTPARCYRAQRPRTNGGKTP